MVIPMRGMPAIPFEHREAARVIDEAMGTSICTEIINVIWFLSQSFAEACFYYLDQLGDKPIKPVEFCWYLYENGQISVSRVILGRIVRESKDEVLFDGALEFLTKIS